VIFELPLYLSLPLGVLLIGVSLVVLGILTAGLLLVFLRVCEWLSL